MERLVRILSVACAVVATVAFASRSVEAETWKFDFGRKDQPDLMAGFKEVTVHDAYDKEKGFGWLESEGEVKAGLHQQAVDPNSGRSDRRGSIDRCRGCLHQRGYAR